MAVYKDGSGVALGSTVTPERAVAERVARDLFGEQASVQDWSVELAATIGDDRRWRVCYAIGPRGGGEPQVVGPLETTDADLIASGLMLGDDGAPRRITFDDLLRHNDLVRRAHEVASRAHDGCQRKHGSPYITHPVSVARLLWETSDSIELPLIAAALLHDVVEDCEHISAGDVERDFGREIGRLVRAVTRARDTAKEEYMATFDGACDATVRLKIADRTDNLQDLQDHPNREKAARYLSQTDRYLVPLMPRVNARLRAAFQAALKRARG